MASILATANRWNTDRQLLAERAAPDFDPLQGRLLQITAIGLACRPLDTRPLTRKHPMRTIYPLVLSAITALGTVQMASAEPDVELGSEIYNDEIGCIVCHEENAVGGYGPNIQGIALEKVQYALATFDDMLMWNADREQQMTEADIINVTAYLATLKSTGEDVVEAAALVYGDDPEPIGLVEGPEPNWPEGPLSMYDDPVSMPEPTFIASTAPSADVSTEMPADALEMDMTGGM